MTTLKSQQERLDPTPPDWQSLTLPDTWPDGIDFSSVNDVLRFFRAVLGKRRRVSVAPDLVGLQQIPKYALQEFHNLPNGNYSNSVTKGYIKGFDAMMLGTMAKSRSHLADFLRHGKSVLDVGCGGGKTAAAVEAVGVPDVWGVDVSPYLLKVAAQENPAINFVQGAAENTGFPDHRFDGVAVCFLFHEIPPKYASLALREFHRILKPGGRLAVAEPSPLQLMVNNPLKLVKHGGLTALYFKALAHTVYEPFVRAWHKVNIKPWLEEHGFNLVADDIGYPIREFYAEKRDEAVPQLARRTR